MSAQGVTIGGRTRKPKKEIRHEATPLDQWATRPFGEIHEDEIVKIAQKVADEKGYAIYEGYEEYMKQRKRQDGLKLSNWGKK